jgi:predicted permease
VSVVATIVFGFLPAIQSARTDIQTAMKDTVAAAGGGFRRPRMRTLLVVVEIAFALVLVVGAALLIRTSLALRAVPPGFASDHVLTMRMSVSGTPFDRRAGIDALTRAGTVRVRAVPGVLQVSTTCCMPLETVWQLPFVVASRAGVGLTRSGNLAFHGFGGWTFVSPGYFDAFRIPLLKGRDFTVHDDASAPGVVIINEAMARRFWREGDPLNDQLIIGRGMRPEYDQDPVRQIIGIVGNVRDTGLNRDARPAMYVPVAQVPDGVTALNVRLLPLVWIVRTAVEPYSLTRPVAYALESVSGGLPVSRVRSMSDVVSESTARTRFDMWLMTIFGCVALTLAAIGLYGLVAYMVRQRTQEIGIRLALGQDPRSIRSMVIIQGLGTALIGAAVGVAAAFGAARVLASLLFGVKPHDPLVFTVVSLTFIAVAALASYVPARRAMKVDPLVALRCQ